MKYKYQKYLSNATTVIEDDNNEEIVITGLCTISLDEPNSQHEASKLADYSYLMLLIDKLSARSYALIEACISDKKQQEAFKMSLRGIVDEQRDKAYREMVLGQ